MSSKPTSIFEWASSALALTTRIVEPTSGTKQDGFEPSQVVSRQQLNWVLNQIGQALQYLFSGTDASGAPTGAMLNYATLEAFVADVEDDRVGCVTEPGAYAGAETESPIVDIGSLYVDGGGAVYYIEKWDGTGPTTYGSMRRATLTEDALLDWSYDVTSTATHKYPIAITGDGTYLYLLMVDFTTARAGHVYKLDKTSGATVATHTLDTVLSSTFPSPVYVPRKIVCDGQYLAVMTDAEVLVYDTNLALVWVDEPGATLRDICFTGDGHLIVAMETGGGGDNIVSYETATGSPVFSNGDLTAQDVTGLFCDGRSVYAIATITGSENVLQMTLSLTTVAFHEHQSSPIWIGSDGRYVFIHGTESGTTYLYQHIGSTQGPLIMKKAVQEPTTGYGVGFDLDGVAFWVAGGASSEAMRIALGEQARIYRRKAPASTTGPWNKLAIPG